MTFKINQTMKTIKYIVMVFALWALTSNLQAQKLSEIYKDSIIQLTVVKDYGLKNNWEQIFYDYNKVSRRTQIGKMKNIIVAPDGSVFMSDKTTYTIAKFDKDGNFVKRFGQKGTKNRDFLYDPIIAGIVDNKYVITHDVQGRIQLFSLDGNFVKLIKLDYIPNRIVPLKGSVIAILGSVIIKDNRIKNIIAIKNLETGVEKIIWQKTEQRGISSINISENLSIYNPLLQFSGDYYSPLIECNKKGDLIVALPNSGEIMQYSKEGNLLKKFKSDISPLAVTTEDIQAHIDQWKQRLISLLDRAKYSREEKEKKINEFDTKVQNQLEQGLYTKNLPYFSSFIMDSDDNLLLFEFTKEKTNQFKVYTLTLEGKSIATTSFQSDDCTLSFIPGKFAFHNGFVYAMAMLKQGGGNIPLRLMKFEVKN